MIESEILVDSVRTDRRQRDLGDIEGLAKSIADVGLLHPIAVTRNTQLVIGLRRLAAVKLLGSLTIPAYHVDTLDEAVELMAAERDDDTERHPMTPSERVAMGRLLEWLDGPARHERRVRAAQAGGVSAPLAPRTGPTSIEKIATALEWSTPTYSRAKHVVIAATNHPDPAVREFAAQQMADMDRTGMVHRTYTRVRPLTRPHQWPNATPTGQFPPLTGVAAQRKAVNAALLALRGVSDGLSRIVDIDERISTDEAAQWVDGLAESRRVIERTINRLRQHTTAKGKAT